MEEDAIRVGLNLHYFWSLNPKQWEKYVKVFNEKEKQRVKELDTLNYILGKYIGYAVNDPKHYPNNPLTEKNNNTLKVMTDEEMEKQARRNTIKMGGVINDS